MKVTDLLVRFGVHSAPARSFEDDPAWMFVMAVLGLVVVLQSIAVLGQVSSTWRARRTATVSSVAPRWGPTLRGVGLRVALVAAVLTALPLLDGWDPHGSQTERTVLARGGDRVLVEQDVEAAFAEAPEPVIEPQLPDDAAARLMELDVSDRDSVAAVYRELFAPAMTIPPGWTGEVETCDPGEESAASIEATTLAVNVIRALAGLPAVDDDAERHSWALRSALMMHAAGENNHHPDPDWPCATTEGIAAAVGNLHLALSTGASSVLAYVVDRGDHNTRVGHRRWILFPPAVRVSTGTTGGANTLWMAYPTGVDVQRPDDVRWVPWPPAGYVPWELDLAPDGGDVLFRWSLSANHRPDADYREAEVEVVFEQHGRQWPVEVQLEPLDDSGPGDNTLVFNVRHADGRPFDRKSDARVKITVSGIRDGGVELDPHRYEVRPFSALIEPDPILADASVEEAIAAELIEAINRDRAWQGQATLRLFGDDQLVQAATDELHAGGAAHAGLDERRRAYEEAGTPMVATGELQHPGGWSDIVARWRTIEPYRRALRDPNATHVAVAVRCDGPNAVTTVHLLAAPFSPGAAPHAAFEHLPRTQLPNTQVTRSCGEDLPVVARIGGRLPAPPATAPEPMATLIGDPRLAGWLSLVGGGVLMLLLARLGYLRFRRGVRRFTGRSRSDSGHASSRSRPRA